MRGCSILLLWDRESVRENVFGGMVSARGIVSVYRGWQEMRSWVGIESRVRAKVALDGGLEGSFTSCPSPIASPRKQEVGHED